MKLYVRKIEDYSDAGTELLEEARRTRLKRIKNPKVRSECIAAGMLLREALADYGYPVGEEPLELAYGPEGKPELKRTENSIILTPYFCLSHSENIVVCAVDDVPVGVDVEDVKKVSSLLPKRVLSDNEYDEYCRISESKSADAAYRYFTVCWTEKESISKLVGKGIGMDFRTIKKEDFMLHTLMRTIGDVEYVITIAQYK